MDFNYRPTSRLLSPAEIQDERTQALAGQQRNALMALQLQGAQEERAQRAQQNALLMQQQQTRSNYFNDLAGNMGPPQEFNAARALAAGIKPEEVKALQGPDLKPMNVAPGGAVFDPKTGRALFTAPFKPEAQKLPEIAQLQAYRATLPPGDPRTAEVDAAIKRMTTLQPATSVTVNTGDPKLPAGVLKQQDELIDRMTTAQAIRADLGAIRGKIESGQLDFGLIRNAVNQGRNFAGASTPESRNFASFKSSLEKLRNDSLRLNAGVQTEGDAQRAWNELFQSINDRDLVLQRLQEIEAINARAEQLQQFRLNVIRQNFGANGLPTPEIKPAVTPTQQPGAVRRYNPATGKIE